MLIYIYSVGVVRNEEIDDFIWLPVAGLAFAVDGISSGCDPPLYFL